ncbi:hypothetical protein LCGC14_2216430, partial [marine sediment metagenome]
FLTALTVLLQRACTDRQAALTTVGMFVLFAAVYPWLRIAESEGLLTTALYVAMLGYVIVLLIHRLRAVPQPAPA